MAFVPRTFEQILTDMINYVKANTGLTDFEIGSVIRTILEAAALEDDEQYFQIVQLLDAFNINTASGPDLDKRVADFDILRLQPAVSAGEIVIKNEALEKSSLVFDVAIGATSIRVVDSSVFPTSGFAYTIRIGEGTIAVEDVSVTANDTSTGVLTILPNTNAHSAGDRVAFVSGAADQAVGSGQQVQVPGNADEPPIKFVTTETGILVNGNYESTPISAKSTIPGSNGNVGVGTVTQFTSSPPFTGATVTNKKPFNGGRDLETDPALTDRARAQIQSLSRGSILALKQAALGVTDPVTSQRVFTANVIEDFIINEVRLYIDDGTGFTPDQTTLAQGVLAAAASSGASQVTVSVADAAKFPAEGQLIISPNSSDIETIAYTDVNYTTGVITLGTTLVNNHLINDNIDAVDPIVLGAESGATFFRTDKFPLVRNSERIWVDNGAGLQLKVKGVDYLLNLGNGQIQFLSGLAANAVVVAHYTYYTGLIFQVQKIISGDPKDSVNFPGIASAGVQVIVQTPVIRRISVQLSITAAPGFNEDDLKPLVQEAVENYISGLGIGENVILASIIQRSMNVNGLFDVIPVVPTGDIVILENELPVPFDSDGNSLISVL